MDAADWDARYAGTESVWGAAANRFVVQHTAALPPGQAVDLACGEGRNARYLAGRGFAVTGVDFSPAAIDKARRLEQAAQAALAARSAGAEQPIGAVSPTRAQHPPGAVPPAGEARPAGQVRWVCADVTRYRPDPTDLVLLVYLHLPRTARQVVLANAAAALRPSGRILVIGHNTRNIAEGTGGPQDPAVLFTAADIVDDLAAVAPDLRVDVAAEPLREVAGADRPAIDTVVLAHRP